MPKKQESFDPPGNDFVDLPAKRYAAGTQMVNGKLEWVWKPVDRQYKKWVVEQKAKAANGVKPAPEYAPKPAIRQRVRRT